MATSPTILISMYEIFPSRTPAELELPFSNEGLISGHAKKRYADTELA